MNIQQLRYVVTIANSGTRETAEKMYVSQPSLSIYCETQGELGSKIFRRTGSRNFRPRDEFYERPRGGQEL